MRSLIKCKLFPTLKDVKNEITSAVFVENNLCVSGPICLLCISEQQFKPMLFKGQLKTYCEMITTVCLVSTIHLTSFSLFSRVQLFATPWTVALRAPLSLGFSQQKYWCELPFASAGDLPNPGIEPMSAAWQVDSLSPSHQGSPVSVKEYTDRLKP